VIFVPVAFPNKKLVIDPVTEFSKLAKKLVEVALVVVEFEALKFVVIVLEALKSVAVVVAKVEVPLTLNVPVAVILLPVAFPNKKLVIDPVIPLRRVEKNEVEVAAVRVVVARVDVPVTVTRLAVRVFVEFKFPEVKLLVVAEVMVALVANREFAVNAEAVAFPNVV
jgi:hypothetical protein